jgi:hypothetical protein
MPFRAQTRSPFASPRPAPARSPLLAGAIAAAFLLPVAAPAAAAPAARCEIPAAAGAAATPAAVRSAATPVPVSDATPAAAAAKAAPSPLAAELESVAFALAACLSEGDAEGVAALVTPSWLGGYFGSDADISQEQWLTITGELDVIPMEIRSVADARKQGSTATAEVVSVVGNQVQRSTWSFVAAPKGERMRGETTWQVDSETLLPVTAPRDAVEIDVTLVDNLITLSESSVEGSELLLRGTNEAEQIHEILVFRFASGFTVGDLLRSSGPALPAEVTWIGQTTIAPGETRDLVLTGLEPGEYTILCVYTTEDGTPHAALGEVTTLTVR